MNKIGFYESDITPPLFGNMSGYFWMRSAEDIEDRLYAKAVVIQSDTTKVAMLTIDIGAVSNDICEKILKRISEHSDITPECISINCTHTHTGGLYRGPDAPEGFYDVHYLREMTMKSADAVIAANRRLVEGNIGYGEGAVYDIAYKRVFKMKDGSFRTNAGVRNPDILEPYGEVDPKVKVLRFNDSDQKPIGAIIIFACHCDCVMLPVYSGDFPSTISDSLKQEYGADFISIFMPGTCGDINHVDVVDGKHNVPFYYRTIGRILATEVKQIMKQIVYPIDSTIDCVKQYFPVSTRRPTAEMLRNAQQSISSEDELIAYRAYDLLSYNETTPATVDICVQLIRIGDQLLYFLPGEMFIEFGKMLETNSPFHKSLIVHLSNGDSSYIPTRELIETSIYESELSSSSFLEKEAGYIIVDRALGIAKRLFEELNVHK